MVITFFFLFLTPLLVLFCFTAKNRAGKNRGKNQGYTRVTYFSCPTGQGLGKHFFAVFAARGPLRTYWRHSRDGPRVTRELTGLLDCIKNGNVSVSLGRKEGTVGLHTFNTKKLPTCKRNSRAELPTNYSLLWTKLQACYRHHTNRMKWKVRW